MVSRIVALLALVALPACTHGNHKSAEPSQVGAAGGRAAPLRVVTPKDDFFGQPQRYLGTEVVMTAIVAEVPDDHTVTLRHGGYFGIPAKNVLVVNDSSMAWDLGQGDYVSVRGVVRERDGEPFIEADGFEVHRSH